MHILILDIENLEATIEIGRQLGFALKSGHVVGLIGPLGSGKTTLVKGVAEGAGVRDLRLVNSPTFVIINHYVGMGSKPPLNIHHVDTYRLDGSEDLEALGFEELCVDGAVVIEWADRVFDLLPADLLTITIEPIDENRRRFHCRCGGPLSAVLLATLQRK
ncbi:MAG: tRNA (adenosine(37)-N6)-threonylcarbamoyltransferase complex ATPase subunit type 1 TsaE [Planctomycetota bacterium]|jgi:tRNA threonylcarbamoyladenosine biosynthesis protein TsaE